MCDFDAGDFDFEDEEDYLEDDEDEFEFTSLSALSELDEEYDNYFDDEDY